MKPFKFQVQHRIEKALGSRREDYSMHNLRTLFIPLLLLVFSFTTTTTWAERSQISSNQFVVGLPSEGFKHFAATQHKQNWCWAACIQMVLNWHGLYVNQEEIVERIYGRQVDRPAQPGQILSALTGWAPDVNGNYSAIQADPVNIVPETVIHDLEYRWPLIVGLSQPTGGGHAYVLTAAYVYNDPNRGPIIYRVVLRDPYPTNPSRIEMDMREFSARCTFATRIHVTRL
jgi:hypothetical protein